MSGLESSFLACLIVSVLCVTAIAVMLTVAVRRLVAVTGVLTELNMKLLAATDGASEE